jgi:hypothetical protein
MLREAVWSYKSLMGPVFERLLGELPGPCVAAAEDCKDIPS